jgi:ferredoxin
VFSVDENDKLHLKLADAIPAELEDKVRMAVKRCPKRAIKLED